MVTAFVFFLIGGAMAELMRVQLAQPEQDLVSRERATTSSSRCTAGSCCSCSSARSPSGWPTTSCRCRSVPRDMAFPRLNALGYWLYLFAGIVMLGGFLTNDGAAKFGWYGYAPLSDGVRSPGVGGDLWIVGIVLPGCPA